MSDELISRDGDSHLSGLWFVLVTILSMALTIGHVIRPWVSVGVTKGQVAALKVCRGQKCDNPGELWAEDNCQWSESC